MDATARPTRLFQRVGCFGGVYSSLYIKGTLHHAGPVADGYVDRSFHLDIDTRAWDRLLQRVCDEFKFPREPPAFYVGVYEREGATGGSFYYGMSIDERDLFAGSNLLETLGIDKTFGIDKETYLNLSTKRPRFLLRRGIAPEHLVHTLNHCWHEKRTPVTITLHRNWDSDLYYLVINQSRQVGGSFKLDGVDLAPWNHLLRAKCERYGIRGKTPSFHLNVIPI